MKPSPNAALSNPKLAARRSGGSFTPEDRFHEAVEPELDDGLVFVSIIGDVGIFVRGDTNDDNTVDISDPIATLGFLFGDMAVLDCLDAADSNDDGQIDIFDPIDTLAPEVHLALGDRERALRELEAFAEQPLKHVVGRMWFLKMDAEFDSLRGEPRFQAVLRKLGLD